MAIDTPARIAVVGAGPIGLEAALYARYLGYEVDVYERGRVAENLLRWGHVRLFSPWRLNVSALGVAALRAQDPQWQPPPDEAMLSGRQLAERYFIPLASCDLLSDSVHVQTEVVQVGREGMLKGEWIAEETRGESPFRVLLLDAFGRERVAPAADAVIDASGTYGRHNWMGRGGIAAIGERQLSGQIEYGLPDVLGVDRARYADCHVLVVGAGCSAATSIVNLAELSALAPGTRVTWITRPQSGDGRGPIVRLPNDHLPDRDQLARHANALAGDPASCVTHLSGAAVEAVAWNPDREKFAVLLADSPSEKIEVDRIVANVGYHPDTRLYEELHVRQCYGTDAPMKRAAALREPSPPDHLDQTAGGADALLNPEPNFYILGAKSFGRDSRFLLSVGREQIRRVFSVIGDRAELDLYATMVNLEGR